MVLSSEASTDEATTAGGDGDGDGVVHNGDDICGGGGTSVAGGGVGRSMDVWL